MYVMRQTVWHVDYLVYVLARDQERGEKAYQEIQQQGCSNIRFHALDVSDTSSIDKLKTFIETKYGGLDVLVNNAGIMFGVSKSDVSLFKLQFLIMIVLTCVLVLLH